MTRFRFLALGAALLSIATAAVSQTQRLPTGITPTGQPSNATGVGVLVAPAGGVTGKGRVVSEDNGMPIKGNITASAAAFVPLGAATLAATSASGRVVLPTGPNYILTNNGATDLFYALGNGSVVATTTSFSLPAGRSTVIAAGSNTNLAAITASGSTSLTITGGTGTPVISGGGGTGGGGGGGDASAANQTTQITAANLTNTDLGPVGASACSTDNGVACAINQLIMRTNQRMTSLITAVGSPLQAGGSVALTGTLPPFASTPTFNCGTGCVVGGGPFVATAASSTLSATTTTSRIVLPGTDTTALLQNQGPNRIHVKVGNGSVNALTTDLYVEPGLYAVIGTGGALDIAGITESGTATLIVTTGTGNPQFGLAQNINASAGVIGSIASGSAATDPPVVAGCRASTTTPTATTDGQVTYARCGARGDVVMRANAPRDLIGEQVTTVTSTTTPATCVTAGGSGVFRDITSITANNTSATDTVFQILDPDGTTVRYSGTAKANDQRGIVLPQVLKMLATNTAWLCKTVTGVSSVVFTLQYAAG